MYEDPIRGSPKNYSSKVYPNGELLPESGTQRGSIYLGDGDPLTPIYPSIGFFNTFQISLILLSLIFCNKLDSAYRIDPKDADELPHIVAQCIGYRLAKEIFDLIDSDEVAPKNWIGEMDVKYVYGGKLKANR